VEDIVGGGMAQVVEHLTRKSGALSSIPSTHKSKQTKRNICLKVTCQVVENCNLILKPTERFTFSRNTGAGVSHFLSTVKCGITGKAVLLLSIPFNVNSPLSKLRSWGGV
jgi:hypothetical protein